MPDPLVAVRSAIEALAATEQDDHLLQTGALKLIETHLGIKLAVWATLDPATLLKSGLRLNGFLQDRLVHLLLHFPKQNHFPIELDMDASDPMSAPWLLARSDQAMSLHQAIGGDLSQSRRFVEQLDAKGIRDELRVKLTDRGTPWGILSMCRSDRTFSRAEVAAFAALGPILGAAQRRCFLHGAIRSANLNDPPGVLMLDRHAQIAHACEAARDLMGDVDGYRGAEWAALFEQLGRDGGPRSMTVMTTNGPLTAHATRFSENRAVLIERTRPFALAPTLLQAYGLTDREREVVEGVCRGCSTREIAFELDLADYTVKDHLKSIFDKMGVRSRKQLVAGLMFRHYLPEIRRRTPPSPYGWFIKEGAAGTA